MKDKSVLVISAVFTPEPVVSAKLSYDIASSLSENNVVTVLSPQPSRPFGFQFSGTTTNFTFNHLQLNSFTCASSRLIGRIKESYSFGIHCYRYIVNNQTNVDVIYANTWPLLGQYFAVKAAKKCKIPILIHVQDIYPESLIHKIPKLRLLLKFLLLPLDKYILRNATQVVAISDQMKSYLAATRNLKKEKIAVVHNWQNEDAFIHYKSPQNRKIEENRPFTFMYLGNIGPVAGIELLIDAFAKENLPNCRLVIAGSGSIKEILQEKTKKQNTKTIEFWSVPEGKVPEIQDQADVMLLPIKKGASGSSIPSKLPAYMFSEKPIIACVDNNSDTANAIISSNSGWVLPPENTDSLAQLMEEIVLLPKEVLLQKGQNGFDYAIHNFSKKNNLQKIIAVINEMSKG